MLFDKGLQKLKESIGIFATEAEKIKRDLSEKLDRRSDLMTLPLPQHDFADSVCEAIDSGLGTDFSRRLRHTMDLAISQPLQPIGNERFNPLTTFDATKLDHAGILFCMKDSIKAGVRETIMSWTDWAKECGPTRAERLKELAALDKQIEALQEKLTKIHGIASDQGVNLSGLGR